jgi:predicted nucleic acid-binding protein
MVRHWLAQPPGWLEVVSPSPSVDLGLSHLDAGETEAIMLALDRRAALLMDERHGTAAARDRGLTVVGTLGVLDEAAALGWLDLPTMFARLSRTTFRCPARLMAIMLEQDAARGRRKL